MDETHLQLPNGKGKTGFLRSLKTQGERWQKALDQNPEEVND